MRLFSYLFLLFASLLVFARCNAPAALSLIESKGPYDEVLLEHVQHLRMFPRHHKQILALEEVLNKAQCYDFNLMDSLNLTNVKGENLPYVNAVHRRIRQRQEYLKPLLPLKSRRGYVPDLLMMKRIYYMEQESRKGAADFFYRRAEEQLCNALEYHSHLAARMAAADLDRIRLYYYPQWRQMDSLRLQADTLGTAFILIRQEGHGQPLFATGFEKKEKWTYFSTVPRPGHVYDYELQYSSPDIHVSSESTSSQIHTEEKKVQCGENIERDSTGKEIRREPIYKTEYVTTYSCKTERSAHGSVIPLLIRQYPTDTIGYCEPLQATDYFSDSNKETTVLNCPTAPTRGEMAERIKNRLRHLLLNKVCEVTEQTYP